MTRTVFPTVPVTVEYALAPLGESLAPALDGLRRWAEENIEAVLAARARQRSAAAHMASGPSDPENPETRSVRRLRR